jgi:hypothetical protein
MAFGDIDLHQLPFVDGKLDRAEAQFLKRIEHRLDSARGRGRVASFLVGRSGHDFPFPDAIRPKSICQVFWLTMIDLLSAPKGWVRAAKRTAMPPRFAAM